MKKKIRNKKVLLAMSGGVDSSVAAVLLLEAGSEVIGIFMKFWSEGESELNKCCSIEAYEDALRVADKLNIKLYTMNMKSIFKKRVVDDFLKQYSCGRTPNPCVQCNKFVKFGEFLKRAKKLGCQHIATGHYIRQFSQFPLSPKSSRKLHVAKDKNKDQSYFLWILNQNQLKHTLFPIGNYTKSQVRKIAKAKGLPVHEKEESQGLCFIKDKRHYDFLRRHLKLKPGPIITLDGILKKGIAPGSVIGQHQGLPLYTIGQRREILIGGIGPFYVVKLDYSNNTLEIAGKFDKSLLFKKKLTTKKINWISGTPPKFPLKCQARIRYLHPLVNCTVTQLKAGNLRVKFKKPQRAVTPGQSVVFYKSQEILGGGVII